MSAIRNQSHFLLVNPHKIVGGYRANEQQRIAFSMGPRQMMIGR